VLTAVEGVYKNGEVELLETPDYTEATRVVVTFLPGRGIVNLRDRGIDREEAAQLRWRLRSMAEDWERPEMEVYDEL